MNLQDVFEKAGFDLQLDGNRYFVTTKLSPTNVACRVGGVANFYGLLKEAVDVFEKVEEKGTARCMDCDSNIYLNWYVEEDKKPSVKTRGI